MPHVPPGPHPGPPSKTGTSTKMTSGAASMGVTSVPASIDPLSVGVESTDVSSPMPVSIAVSEASFVDESFECVSVGASTCVSATESNEASSPES